MALDQETFQLLKDSVQRFVRERLVPAENHLEEHDEVPTDIVADMKELGCSASRFPRSTAALACRWPRSARSPMSLARQRLRSAR